MNIRHGDVNLAPFEGEIEGKKLRHSGSFVLAEGETTGHKHVLTVANPNDMTISVEGSTFYITLETEGTLSHEEHKTIKVPPGVYKQIQEREKDWFSLSVRRVID